MRSPADAEAERQPPTGRRHQAALGPARKLKVPAVTAWAHHRSGWRPCGQMLQRLARGDGRGVLLIDAVERLVREEVVLDEPWVGFVHKALRAPPHVAALYGPKRDVSLPAMIATDTWRRNMERCRGLFCLSDYLRVYLQPRVPCPVEVVAHPTSFDCPRFDLAAFVRGADKRLLLVGHWLRRFESFYALAAPGFRKSLLKCQEDGLYERLRQFLPDDDGVELLPWQPSASYDRLLSSGVVFLDLIDASANNTVIECLARDTPLLVNRHPAVTEYLGPEYPLYFDDLAHAARLLRLDELERAHAYLCRAEALKDRVRFPSFERAVIESTIYRSL